MGKDDLCCRFHHDRDRILTVILYLHFHRDSLSERINECNSIHCMLILLFCRQPDSFVFPQSVESELALANDARLQKLILWYNAFCGSIAPSFMMTTLMLLLIRIIRRSENRRQRILNVRIAVQGHQRSQSSVQKTKLLLIITLLYMACLVPIGSTIIGIGWFGKEFKNNVFDPLWCLFDILSLVNASINFLLLVSMSSVYRETFLQIFWPREKSTESIGTAETSSSSANSKRRLVSSGVQGQCSLNEEESPSISPVNLLLQQEGDESKMSQSVMVQQRSLDASDF